MAGTLLFNALREAIDEEMARDPHVCVMGEDVGKYGGCYAVTKGLLEEFGPARIVDTPLAELEDADVILLAGTNTRWEAPLVNTRIRKAVRRGTTLFALPIHAADGAKAIWETADSIWEGLGDRANDFNWYSKRATLAGVYSATVLYWLGDQSPDHAATWAFLDRRIDDVMQIEKLKKSVNENPALKPLMAGPNWLLGKIRPPARVARIDLPGYIRPKDQQ